MNVNLLNWIGGVVIVFGFVAIVVFIAGRRDERKEQELRQRLVFLNVERRLYENDTQPNMEILLYVCVWIDPLNATRYVGEEVLIARVARESITLTAKELMRANPDYLTENKKSIHPHGAFVLDENWESLLPIDID